METPAQAPQTYRRMDHGAHVLVVEDDPVTLMFLSGVLQLNSYRLTAVSTAREAMAALDRELPDLVILDLQLPDTYGLEVCKYLRQFLDGEDIPVLVVTVEDGRDGHARSVRAGADDFLRKPILAAELITRTRSLLRLRILRRQMRADREAILGLQAQKESLFQYLAHDMRNLLGAAQASLGLLMDEADPGRQARFQTRMGESLRGLEAMVKDLLDLSVGEQAVLEADREPLDLGPWLEKVVHEFEPLAVLQERRLVLDCPGGLQAEADLPLLRRVLSNLLENAIRWAPMGSTIEVAATAGAGCVRLMVSDEGPGVPGDLKEAIFERFVRLGEQAGHGLGLAFCRQVAALHQGRIWVEDREPRGSRFILELPVP